MTRRVWIDTDMGFDDLAAIVTVLADSTVEVVGMSLVAGNASLPVVAANAARAAAFLQWRMPIHLGRASPLLGAGVSAGYALGEGGMRTAGRTLPEAAAALSALSAFDAMSAAFAETGEKVEILALGPLTNMAVLLMARPELRAGIRRIVWMGGSAGPGNHSAAAEFNAFVDPEAVEIVVASGVQFLMVGLDCCRQVTVSLGDAAKLRSIGTETGEVLADLLEGYVRIASADGSRPMALYDPVAAAALLDPLAVAFSLGHIDIERGGNAGRGATFVDRRVPHRATANADVAVTADAARVRDRVLGALAAVAMERDAK